MKEPATGLTFDWPGRVPFPFILFGCVALSILAHAATFFVFQVVYPQRVTIPPPAPQVALLIPGTPENDALLRWIAAEDPALVASARSVVPPDLLSVPYRPSFVTPRTAPLSSVEVPAPILFPPARDALAVVTSAIPRPAPESGAPLPMRTTIELSAALADRELKPPSFRWRERATRPLEPLRAMIGVSDRGEVRFTFLQHSSGNARLDTEALRQLESLAFAHGGPALTWALATLHFGAEAYATTPAELRERPPP